MRRTKTLLCRALKGLALLAACTGAAASAQDWTFESGTLRGWTSTGRAFANQPTFGNNIAGRRPGDTPGQAGNWWVGTYENRPSPADPAGGTQDDALFGTLVSDRFTVARPFINFLVGGGSDIRRVRVELLVALRDGERPAPLAPDGTGGRVSFPEGDYTVRATASGSAEERMHRVQWNVRDRIGRNARIRIVDHSDDEGGHINVDDFQFSNAPIAIPVETATARFRITARGFRVGRQTYDDALNRDGWGDEVFVRADVFSRDPGGRLSRLRTARTVRINERFTGNSSPTADPVVGRGGDPRSNDLPLLIWQGELTEGGAAAIVIPSIWEWDGPAADGAERLWETLLGRTVEAGLPAIRDIIGERAAPGTLPPYGTTLSIPIADDGTRPIGLPGARHPAVPMELHAIVLSYGTALALSDGVFVEPYVAQDMDVGTRVDDGRRLPRGVFWLHFRDGEGLDGRYTLYLHVERLR